MFLQQAPTPSEFARLKVSGSPDSSRVYLDSVYRGRSPIVIDSVKPGPHSIWVYKVGFTSQLIHFAAHAGETAELLPQLLPAFGDLVVTSNREDTRFFLDGRLIGEGAETDSTLAPTTYLLEARSGDRSAAAEISITREQKNFWSVALGVPSTKRVVLGGLFPGTNQLSDASFVKGCLFLGAAIGSVAYLAMTDRTYRTAQSAFDDARAAYLVARDEPTARSTHEFMRLKHDALKDASVRANVALGVTISVWALNLVDVILHHALTDTIGKFPEKPAVQLSAGRHGGETQLVLSYAF
jgi:hypothetical protein